MWELIVPTAGVMNDSGVVDDDLVIRCRSVSIPGRSTEVITSEFMGMKQYFPSKPIFDGTVDVTYEETEDQPIKKALTEWQQKIYSTDTGVQTVPFIDKRLQSKTLTLIMYDGKGDSLDRKIQFINAWPQNVPSVALSYAGSEQVIYSVTFQYDFWKLV